MILGIFIILIWILSQQGRIAVLFVDGLSALVFALHFRREWVDGVSAYLLEQVGKLRLTEKSRGVAAVATAISTGLWTGGWVTAAALGRLDAFAGIAGSMIVDWVCHLVNTVIGNWGRPWREWTLAPATKGILVAYPLLGHLCFEISGRNWTFFWYGGTFFFVLSAGCWAMRLRAEVSSNG